MRRFPWQMKRTAMQWLWKRQRRLILDASGLSDQIVQDDNSRRVVVDVERAA